MFAAPPEHTIEWSSNGVEGAHRFLRRLWTFAQAQGTLPAAAPQPPGNGAEAALAARRDIHLALKQANYDYERIQYNTVVSASMKMLNTLEQLDAAAPARAAVVDEGLSILLRVLYPVVPHTTWVLWNDLGYAARMGDLLDARWPTVDEGALAQEEVELVLQINGKLRGKLVVASAAASAALATTSLPRSWPLICSTSSTSSCASAPSSTVGQRASSRSPIRAAYPRSFHNTHVVCGTTGYSTRSRIERPSSTTAARAGAAASSCSSVLSIFIDAETTVLYWMRS